ncbi:hypothetical protein BH10PSE2_BH10PSE2_18790 [soil metagenome]
MTLRDSEFIDLARRGGMAVAEDGETVPRRAEFEMDARNLHEHD